jgi:hypothetical protein
MLQYFTFIQCIHTENKIVNAITMDAHREEREATPAKKGMTKKSLYVCESGNIFH